MKFIKKLFGINIDNKTTSVSGFFRDASPGDKEKLIREVTKESNKDQRELADKHSKMFPKTT